MPRVNDYTELLGETLLQQIDALCEEIKTQIGWPPLGQKELSPSAAKRREHDDAGILAELFERVGPQRSLALLKNSGLELLDQFGETVIAEAMARASRTFAAEMGNDGRESYVEPTGGER